MPYINIRLGIEISSMQRKQLFEKTTFLMNEVMNKNPEVTVVNIHETGPEQWSVNSQELTPDKPTGAYVGIKVTTGTNTATEKAEMIEKTVKMLQDVVGIIQKACYVVIDDIPANSWGYDGQTQESRAASSN